MYILGINAYHGDAAAALSKDGRLVAAVSLWLTSFSATCQLLASATIRNPQSEI
jgi:hypothetical protein